MKQMLMIVLLCGSLSVLSQQREKFFSVTATTQHTAFPFSKFGSLFTKEFHPGFEAGLGILWRSRKKHDLFQNFHAGYFYHRFVQHAIPLHTQFGYRFKFSDRFSFQAAIGGGYLHSITDAAVLKHDGYGNYHNAKGLGRGQAILLLSMGPEMKIHLEQRTLTLFLKYAQQLQTPFIKSYVPMLPYNQMGIGGSFPLKPRSK